LLKMPLTGIKKNFSKLIKWYISTIIYDNVFDYYIIIGLLNEK